MNLYEEINKLNQRLLKKPIIKWTPKKMQREHFLDYIDIKQLKLFDKAIRLFDEADLARHSK